MAPKTKYPLKPNAFTEKGFNDRPKPCLKQGCKGKVYPTRNANMGKCNKCGETFSWGEFIRRNK